MSVLNKIPFINTVLNELGEENLGTLRSLMNGSGDRTELLRTMNVPAGNRTRISVSDKGVHLCSLQVGPTLYHGYLLYTDEQCLLIHFTDFQSLSMFSIDVAHNELRTVTEYLDINELRYIVNDLLIQGGELGDLVEIKEVTNLPATGEEDTIYLSDSNVIDPDDGPIEVPAPTAVNAGKLLGVGANGGYEFKTAPDVEEAIQADKELDNQLVLEYDSDNDRLHVIFPPNIMPICAWDANVNQLVFFNYTEQTLEGATGNVYGNLYRNNSNIVVVYEGKDEEDYAGYTDIQYMYVSSFDDMTDFINWQKVLNPAPGGTKLYLHDITNNTKSLGFRLVTTYNTPITLDNLPLDDYYAWLDWVTVDFKVVNTAYVTLGMVTDENAHQLVAICYDLSNNTTIKVVLVDETDSISDRVTEL